MNGPQHYLEAQRLIAAVTFEGTHPDGSPIVRQDEPGTIALAQVHATLALAAALGTLDAMAAGVSGAATGRTPDDVEAWREAIS